MGVNPDTRILTDESIAEIRRKANDPNQGRMPTSVGGGKLGHFVVWQEVVSLCDHITAISEKLQDCHDEMGDIVELARERFTDEDHKHSHHGTITYVMVAIINLEDKIAAIENKPASEVVICAAYTVTRKTWEPTINGIKTLLPWHTPIYRANRHHDCIALMARDGIDKTEFGESGFITSTGRFVGRKEAFILQHKAGIESASPDGYRRDELYSEDLY